MSAVTEDMEYWAALTACSVCRQSGPVFSKKALMQVVQMLGVGGQAEMYCTGKLQGAVNRVMPTFADKETLGIICRR